MKQKSINLTEKEIISIFKEATKNQVFIPKKYLNSYKRPIKDIYKIMNKQEKILKILKERMKESEKYEKRKKGKK